MTEKRINEICETLKNLDWFQRNYTINPASISSGNINNKGIKERTENFKICSAYIKKLEKELIKLLEQVNKNTQTNPEE